ncbi:MAG: hypothetical protein QM750_19840 [Rubrivivax sp.]
MPHLTQLIGSVSTEYGCAEIYVGRYPVGGAIAVELFLGPEPDNSVIFSTNLVPSGATLANDEFTVKCWGIEEAFVEPVFATGLFENTGRRVSSGYVAAQVWRLKDPTHVPPAAKRVRRARF